MLMNGNQRYRFGCGRISEPLDHARARQAQAALGTGLFGFDQFSVLSPTRRIRSNKPFFAFALINRDNAPAFRCEAKNT